MIVTTSNEKAPCPDSHHRQLDFQKRSDRIDKMMNGRSSRRLIASDDKRSSRRLISSGDKRSSRRLLSQEEKHDDMVKSLAWLSMHVPKCVLDDISKEEKSKYPTPTFVIGINEDSSEEESEEEDNRDCFPVRRNKKNSLFSLDEDDEMNDNDIQEFHTPSRPQSSLSRKKNSLFSEGFDIESNDGALDPSTVNASDDDDRINPLRLAIRSASQRLQRHSISRHWSKFGQRRSDSALYMSKDDDSECSRNKRRSHSLPSDERSGTHGGSLISSEDGNRSDGSEEDASKIPLKNPLGSFGQKLRKGIIGFVDDEEYGGGDDNVVVKGDGELYNNWNSDSDGDHEEGDDNLYVDFPAQRVNRAQQPLRRAFRGVRFGNNALFPFIRRGNGTNVMPVVKEVFGDDDGNDDDSSSDFDPHDEMSAVTGLSSALSPISEDMAMTDESAMNHINNLSSREMKSEYEELAKNEKEGQDDEDKQTSKEILSPHRKDFPRSQSETFSSTSEDGSQEGIANAKARHKSLPATLVKPLVNETFREHFATSRGNSASSSDLTSSFVKISNVNEPAVGQPAMDRGRPGLQRSSSSGYVSGRDIPEVDKSDVLHSVLMPSSRQVMRISSMAKIFSVPPVCQRKSALLFVDISGFTKLSRAMELESFSVTINSYFECLINEILDHEGDILKFAGDALFAEWRSTEPVDNETNGSIKNLNDFMQSQNQNPEKTLSKCTADAALCGASIVEKYSDWSVPGCSVMLNVHCGLGVGLLTGIHVEDNNNTRREYLFLGHPIDQVSKAEAMAESGELVASVESIKLLTEFCRVPPAILKSETPSLIASRRVCKITQKVNYHVWKSAMSLGADSVLSVYDSFDTTYSHFNMASLEKLRRQMSLYIHPVVCEDEFGKHNIKQSSTKKFAEQRHREEAELRSVFVMFIKPEIDASITGNPEEDAMLFERLDAIMKTVCRELDNYNGQLRQFIVDDKGVVLIASFGLRFSFSPNMVAGKAVPATLAIHSSLRDELGIDSRIGATYGKAYCGVVGGLRRHEYAILGPSVNLAARLMCSSQNRSILVDIAAKEQAGDRYSFREFMPVKAKGYSAPVPIFEVEQPFSQCTCQFSRLYQDVEENNGDAHNDDHRDGSVCSSVISVCHFCKFHAKRRLSSDFSTTGVIEQRCFQRIDEFGITNRNILQSCAVLGDKFDLSDVLRAHSKTKNREMIEEILETAISENIIRDVTDENSCGSDDNNSDIFSTLDQKDRTFEFCHELWRKCLLKPMLKERRRSINQNVTNSLMF